MPELPEVETIRRDLARDIVGLTIQGVIVNDPRVLRQPREDFIKRLNGKKIERIDRRGKALIMALSGGDYLVVQVMMTGQMVVDAKAHSHTRVMFDLGKRQLMYHDQRVFGQLRVVGRLNEVPHLNHLGPEPFDGAFNEAYVNARLKRTARPIKSVLLDHGFVAGIGNIYASEILYRSKISPLRLGNSIKKKEVKLIIDQTKEVLQEAIRLRGSSMRNYRDGKGEKGEFNQSIRVYARTEQPCLTCGAPILRIVQSGRSTFYCKKCQR